MSLEDAREVVARYIYHYNNVRFNSASGYIAPLSKLEGRETSIFQERDRRLEATREEGRKKRQQIGFAETKEDKRSLVNLN